MNFKQFLLLEMPHFTIANKSYDLYAEKDKSVFKNAIKIFRNYSKSDIQTNLLNFTDYTSIQTLFS